MDVSQKFAITGSRIFDGSLVHETGTVLVEGDRIAAVTQEEVDLTGYDEIDGQGATLMPGLVDAHAHPAGDDLSLAMLFGVTTVYDMFTVPERLGDQRNVAEARNDVADIRSASTGATVLGGHPSMLIGLSFREQFPVISGPSDAAQFVRDRVAEGADFIKLLIDDGTALGHASPSLDEECARIVVEEAHRHGLLAVAHATSADNTLTAVRAGVDGLVHVFMDKPPSEAVIAAIADSGVFVVPTLVTMGSMAGDLTGQEVAADSRTQGLVPDDWRQNLCTCWQLGSPSSLANAQQATHALHLAGVRILAGTDAAEVGIFGTVPGISLHHELAQLVDCGLSPSEALTAATSVAAESFGLTDRGRIEAGRQADLVLVDGDPTTTIGDSLSIREVWRRGERLDRRLSEERIVASSATLPSGAAPR